MPEESDRPGRPGRPRSLEADKAILGAARDLIAEGGLANLTVEGTAARAGVAKTTVYRRCPSRLDLAVAAIAALVHDPPDTDSLDAATDMGLTMFEQNWTGDGSQAAYLAVAAAAAADPEIHRRFVETVLAPVHRNLEVTLEAARERGEAGPEVDLDFVHDVLSGTILHRAVIRQLPLDESFRSQYADLVRFVFHHPR